jgi:hypothetical protein
MFEFLTLIENAAYSKEPIKEDNGYKTITFDNNATYTGELKDGMVRHGFGKQVWPDGTM